MSTPIQTGQDDPSGNLEEPVAPEDGQCTLYFGGSGSKLSGRMSTTGPESASNLIPETCTCTSIFFDRSTEARQQDVFDEVAEAGHEQREAECVGEDPRCHQQCARDEDHDAVRERARGELATVHLLLSAGQNRETLPPCQIRTHDAGEDDQRERRPRTEIDSHLDEKTELHGGDDDEQQKKLSHTAIIGTFSCRHRKKELQMDNPLQSLRFDTGVRRQRCGWWNHDVGELVWCK